MADLSDDGIKRSFSKVSSEREPTNWLSISYAEGSTDKFILHSVGTGGISELARSMSPTFQGYAYIRVSPNPKCKTTKFALIQYVGEKCTAFQKARVIVHLEDVLNAFKPVNAIISASSPKDLSEDALIDATNASND